MKGDDEPRAREGRAWSSRVGGKTHQAEGRGDLSDGVWLSPVSKSLVLQRSPLGDADSPTLLRMREYNRGCTGPHVQPPPRESQLLSTKWMNKYRPICACLPISCPHEEENSWSEVYRPFSHLQPQGLPTVSQWGARSKL